MDHSGRVVDRTNRRQTQTPAHQAPPCTLVIFGAGGDLTKRLLMPAIYNLAKDKFLSRSAAPPLPDPRPNSSTRRPGSSSRAASSTSPAT